MICNKQNCAKWSFVHCLSASVFCWRTGCGWNQYICIVWALLCSAGHLIAAETYIFLSRKMLVMWCPDIHVLQSLYGHDYWIMRICLNELCPILNRRGRLPPCLAQFKLCEMWARQLATLFNPNCIVPDVCNSLFREGKGRRPKPALGPPHTSE